MFPGNDTLYILPLDYFRDFFNKNCFFQLTIFLVNPIHSTFSVAIIIDIFYIIFLPRSVFLNIKRNKFTLILSLEIEKALNKIEKMEIIIIIIIINLFIFGIKIVVHILK